MAAPEGTTAPWVGGGLGVGGKERKWVYIFAARFIRYVGGSLNGGGGELAFGHVDFLVC